MLLNLGFIFIGVTLVLWGADKLTDGSVAIAQKMRVSQVIIGLTVVAMGTSMPEFSVSLVSALKGTSDLAIGNVIGSNIINSLFIVGVSAMFSPILITPITIKKDIPFALVSSVVLMMLCYDGMIGRIDAGIIFAMFIIFMIKTLQEAKSDVKIDKANSKSIISENIISEKQHKKIWVSVIWIIVGLLCLILGSNLFVSGAVKVASSLGVSDAIIGLTIVAGGTSLPELATSVVAARKGDSGIAIGNVIGSNIFNILAILGVTGLIHPMLLQGITMFDLSIMVISMILIWFLSFTKYTIERWEGFCLIVVFIGYMVKLLVSI
ncbi:K+-dependent Na+/Ca+ exchanger family protein [Prevotella amnii CRIS 21A-A]|uniref:K+-dependent Na+/Ca+ exchanger family protein n=1 Tax=Prevotella amnii CRIS 21A-A TaxID=679191 RepID=E1GUW5_9BACT|nr:calcium/sodium antiporter [Prevotella amnii]EFN91572.1 K+-dependent Na+/Ca+ exchanger family protein [Prevotella amnii CRIS 21A-A]